MMVKASEIRPTRDDSLIVFTLSSMRPSIIVFYYFGRACGVDVYASVCLSGGNISEWFGLSSYPPRSVFNGNSLVLSSFGIFQPKNVFAYYLNIINILEEKLHLRLESTHYLNSR